MKDKTKAKDKAVESAIWDIIKMFLVVILLCIIGEIVDAITGYEHTKGFPSTVHLDVVFFSGCVFCLYSMRILRKHCK